MPKDFWGGSLFIVERYAPLLFEGMKITLYISLLGTIIGCVVGLFVAILRQIPINENDSIIIKIIKKFMKFILAFYVEYVRGTPMIVQAMFIYYGSKSIGMTWGAVEASLFIVSLNTGAYAAEIMRGGIISIDNGQFEGARAIGMSQWQTMCYVIIPQAIRNALPSIGNEFVINIKDTSVLNVIGLNELFLQTRSISGIHYRVSETFFVTANIYFILTFTITRLLLFIENRYDRNPSMKIPSQSLRAEAYVDQRREK